MQNAGRNSIPTRGKAMTISNPAMMFDVSGQTALITGASGAFGMVAARILAGAGCNLVLAAGNQAALDEIATECRGMGANVTAVNTRPSDEVACNNLVAEAVKAYGGLDILVVASGMNKVALINDMAPETFTSVMDANVTQSWLLARAAAGQMKQQVAAGTHKGGKIVLVSSARGLLGHPAGYTAYCASKAATDGMVKALGCELGPTGITVNAIAPTVFRSPLTAWMFEDNEKANAVRAGFLARVPKGRLGEPEDLAGPLLFLASKASDFYTGHILYADGGYTAG
jgi:NAD(P)-dependent dehydrogenase (short-subunit alcohol dehydrogenase family)